MTITPIIVLLADGELSTRDNPSYFHMGLRTDLNFRIPLAFDKSDGSRLGRELRDEGVEGNETGG